MLNSGICATNLELGYADIIKDILLDYYKQNPNKNLRWYMNLFQGTCHNLIFSKLRKKH